jgi:hypothetical protein
MNYRQLAKLVIVLLASAAVLYLAVNLTQPANEKSGSESVAGKKSTPAPTATAAKLSIILRGVGSKTEPGIDVAGLACTKSIPATCHASLECKEGDTDARCEYLADHVDELFQNPPKGQACTMIYGGAQTAQITGTALGEDVDFALSRTDGCKIAQWELHAPLWTS